MMAYLGNFKNFKMTVKDIQAPPLEKLNHKTMGTLFCYLLVCVTCLLLRYPSWSWKGMFVHYKGKDKNISIIDSTEINSN